MRVDELMKPFSEYMAKNGITNDLVLKALKAELKAKETTFFQHQGKVTAQRNVIAWKVRQEARRDIHRLRGDYAPEKHDVDHNIVYLAPKKIKKLKATAK